MLSLIFPQAGHFGVPQNRRRIVIMAAAPGQILPKMPKPTTQFSCSNLSVKISGQTIWTCESDDAAEAAPFRTVSIREAISDLPTIEAGDQVSPG